MDELVVPPGIFVHPARWGDLAAALTVLIVLVVCRDRKILATAIQAVAAVAAAGIADAVSLFFFGFLSSPTALQLIAYPTRLTPVFLILFALLFYILSLAELRRAP